MSESDSQPVHPKYRPDIDGLRAIAVLSVVAFHAFPLWMKGGFIGVDIFFVISGFLISTIIFENLDGGRFSFLEFYSRRIKRIFPALLVVLLACYALAWFALLADEYKQLGKHIAAGAAFVSNLLLWSESGYFDNASQTKPLLHLWSLGIEEQFYIAWPLLVWFAWRQRQHFATLMLFLLIASFCGSLYLMHTDAVAAFYSPLARFWELLSGALLAWFGLHGKPALVPGTAVKKDVLSDAAPREAREHGANALADGLSLIGMTLLVGGFWLLTTDSAFPGTWALVPVAGAVLIILAGNRAWLNRTILANPVVVWVGLISFPLYLWHWPLLSFARIIESQEPSAALRLAIVVISFVLAWLTHKLIERPLRQWRGGLATTAVLVLLMSAMAAVGYGTYERDGLLNRKYASLGAIGDIGHSEFHKFLADNYFPCRPQEIEREALRYEGYVRCRQSKQGGSVDVALIGDSHAEHLFLGVADALPRNNVAFYIRNGPPFVDNADFKTIFDFVIRGDSVKVVVLTMYWNYQIHDAPSRAKLEMELLATADALLAAGKKVYVVDDVPTFPFGPDKCGQRWLSSERVCDMDETYAVAQSLQYSGALHELIRQRPQIQLFDVSRYLCERGVCSMASGNRLLYRDVNHLNIIGSRYVGRRLVEDHIGYFDPAPLH